MYMVILLCSCAYCINVWYLYTQHLIRLFSNSDYMYSRITEEVEKLKIKKVMDVKNVILSCSRNGQKVVMVKWGIWKTFRLKSSTGSWQSSIHVGCCCFMFQLFYPFVFAAWSWWKSPFVILPEYAVFSSSLFHGKGANKV